MINYRKNFLYWFIRGKNSKNSTEIKNNAIKVCNLYLSDEYIPFKTKKEIFFIFKLNTTKIKIYSSNIKCFIHLFYYII